MLKGIDMVVYQALKHILGSACVTAVLEDEEYNERMRDQGYSDDSDEEDNACVSASLNPVLISLEYEEEGIPDPGTIEGEYRGAAFPRRAVTWLNHRPHRGTDKEFAIAFITVSYHSARKGIRSNMTL